MDPIVAESPFASYRELSAVKDELLSAIDGVKSDLLAAISKSDARHSDTHRSMLNNCDARHGPLDEHLRGAMISQAERKGMAQVAWYVLRTVQLAQEFRWLILLIMAGLLAASGQIRVIVS